MKLILIRHGESEYNASLTKNLDSNLTIRGKEQAILTGRFLKENVPDIEDFTFLTSPYARCLQTSDCIKDQIEKNVVKVNAGPREIMVNYEQVKIKNRKKDYPHFDWNHDHDLEFFQETDDEFVERMHIFYKELIESSLEKVIVVSHGSPVNTIFEIASGLDGKADTMNYVRNCSISYIKDGEKIWFDKVVYE